MMLLRIGNSQEEKFCNKDFKGSQTCLKNQPSLSNKT